MWRRGLPKRGVFPGRSATPFAAGHDGVVEAFAKARRHFVDFVGAVDLDRLARGFEGDLAMLAAVQMFLEVSAQLCRGGIVDQFIEKGKKLSAGHFSTPSVHRMRRPAGWMRTCV